MENLHTQKETNDIATDITISKLTEMVKEVDLDTSFFQSVPDFRAIAVFGNTGSGKTALAYRICEEFAKAGMPVYFLKHPQPKILESFGYKNLNSLEDIATLQDCVVFWDEVQLFCEMSDYKRDTLIAKILSLARQRSITLICSSSDTRTFSKRIEAYFDLWIIKDCEFDMTKQRSMIRKIMTANSIITPAELKISKESFLAYNRKHQQYNGLRKFNLVKGWSDKVSKPYMIS